MKILFRIRSIERTQSDVVPIQGATRILFNIPRSPNQSGCRSLGIEIVPGSDRIRAHVYRAGDPGPTMEIGRNSEETISIECGSGCFFLELKGIVGLRIPPGSEPGEVASSQGWFWIERIPTADYATPIVCGAL